MQGRARRPNSVLAISTAFGLMASTLLLVLLTLPCMYLILGDLGIVEQIRE